MYISGSNYDFCHWAVQIYIRIELEIPRENPSNQV